MITLKLANYTQAEIDALALLLCKMQSHLHVYCKQHENCLTCPAKNVCLDLKKHKHFVKQQHHLFPSIDNADLPATRVHMYPC